MASQPIPNSTTVLHNVGVGVYFEWNACLQEVDGPATGRTAWHFCFGRPCRIWEQRFRPPLAATVNLGEVDNHSKLLHSCRSYGMRWSER